MHLFDETLLGERKNTTFAQQKTFCSKDCLPASLGVSALRFPLRWFPKGISYSKVPPSGSMFKLSEGGVSKMAGNFDMFDGIPSAEVACTLTKF